MNEDSFPQSAPPANGPQLCRTSPPHRILVADDEACIRMLLATVLIGSGYDVDVAEDGAAAWEALQARPYDLLITDHNMPRITGLELIKNLRSAHMRLPVVMVAGELPEYELNRSPSLQLAATLLKPFALDALMETVKRALRGVLPQMSA